MLWNASTMSLKAFHIPGRLGPVKDRQISWAIREAGSCKGQTDQLSDRGGKITGLMNMSISCGVDLFDVNSIDLQATYRVGLRWPLWLELSVLKSYTTDLVMVMSRWKVIQVMGFTLHFTVITFNYCRTDNHISVITFNYWVWCRAETTIRSYLDLCLQNEARSFLTLFIFISCVKKNEEFCINTTPK